MLQKMNVNARFYVGLSSQRPIGTNLEEYNKNMKLDISNTGQVIPASDAGCLQSATDAYSPLITELDEVGSFEQYCIRHFSCDWLYTLSKRVSEGTTPVGKQSELVPVPNTQFIVEADIRRMEFSRMDRMHFYADAIVTAEIEVSAQNRDRHVSDRLSQWYRLRHIFTTTPHGYTVDAISTTVYDKGIKNPGLPLDEYLIPVLSTQDLEDEADAILREYCPEVYLSGSPVDGELLANRMGLSILDLPLTAMKLLGQAVFFDGHANTDHGSVMIPANTILINNNIKMDSIQRTKVILHECCHHYEHDLFMWAQSLYNHDIVCFDCPVNSTAFIKGEKSPLFWAEQQARMLTYRVQMNRFLAMNTLNELKKTYISQHHALDPGKEMEWLIRQFSDYFHTTKQCARNRLTELGCHKAQGIFHYVDGQYIPPFFFSEGVLEKNQTFLIGIQAAAEEYGRNEHFRELISSGKYLYIEGRFCQIDSSYVQMTGNGFSLTSYARMHTEECCLRFEIIYSKQTYQYVWGEFHWDTAVAINRSGRVVVIPQNAAEPGLCDIEVLTQQALWNMDVRKTISGMEFGEALSYLMSVTHTSKDVLEERCLLSTRTIARLRNDPDYTVTREHVIALSIGMQLSPMISMELLRLAGLQLTNSFLHNLYGTILCSMYTYDIYTVNSFLEKAGAKPLTSVSLLS